MAHLGPARIVAIILLFFVAGPQIVSFPSVAETTREPSWEYEAGDGLFSKPAVIDDKVYFVGAQANAEEKNGALFAIDADTGRKVWSVPFPHRVWCCLPVVIGDVVYVGGKEEPGKAVDADTGSVLWTGPIGYPVGGGETIYVNTVDPSNDDVKTIKAIDARSGRVKWTHPKAGSQWGGAYCAASAESEPGVLYVVTSPCDGKETGENRWTVSALDEVTGETKWNHGSTSRISDMGLMGPTVHIETTGDNVTVLEKSSGKQLWSYRWKNGFKAIEQSLFTIENDVVSRLDIRTGSIQWEKPLTREVNSDEEDFYEYVAGADDDMVIVAQNDNIGDYGYDVILHLSGLDLETGNERWEISFRTGSVRSIGVVQGLIIIPCLEISYRVGAELVLKAFEASTGDLAWEYRSYSKDYTEDIDLGSGAYFEAGADMVFVVVDGKIRAIQADFPKGPLREVPANGRLPPGFIWKDDALDVGPLAVNYELVAGGLDTGPGSIAVSGSAARWSVESLSGGFGELTLEGDWGWEDIGFTAEATYGRIGAEACGVSGSVGLGLGLNIHIGTERIELGVGFATASFNPKQLGRC